MSSRLLPFAVIISLIFGGLFLAQRDHAQIAKSNKLSVVTTFLPVYVFVLNVVGDRADVSMIVPANQGPHDYSFSPYDLARLKNSDLVIKNGLGIDDWIDRAVETAKPGSETKIINLSRGLGPNALANAKYQNPHVWNSPRLVKKMVEIIREALIAIDNQGAEYYTINAQAYLAKLESLDHEILDGLKKLDKVEYVALEPSWSYFAKDYGLVELAIIQENEEGQLSPDKYKTIKRLFDSRRRKVILTNLGSESSVVNTIALDNHAKIYEIDSFETGTVNEDAYETLMKKNLMILNEAFGNTGN